MYFVLCVFHVLCAFPGPCIMKFVVISCPDIVHFQTFCGFFFYILCEREKPKDRPYLFSGEFAADTSWVLGEKRRFHKTILPEEQCPPFTYMLFKGANG